MDYETISAADFGRSLRGIGLNLLVRDVVALAGFLGDVFGMKAHRINADFAIMTYCEQVFQLHADATYHSNPLLGSLPEAGARGGGLEIRLYDNDPDKAVAAARAHGHNTTILQEPSDKPHGLREAYIFCENGYAWVPSVGLAE
jgi:hypothetical protein